MNCLEFRRAVQADPAAADDAGLAEHAASCEGCARLKRRALAMDARLRSALQVEPPKGLADRIVYAREAASRRPTRMRQFALAAGLLLGVSVTGFALSPAPSAAAIVAHVAEEGLSAAPPDAAAPERLAARAEALGGRVSGLKILRVNFCLVGGRPLLHLVMEGEHGPVDVVVAPASIVVAPTPVASGGLEGWIAPGRRCGLAVLGPAGAAPARRDLDRALAGIVWHDAPSGLFGQALANLSNWLSFARFAVAP